MRKLVSTIYDVVVAGNQKAIVAAVVGFVGSLGLQVDGLSLVDASVAEIIASLVNSAIMAAAVWLKANR